MRGHRKGRKKWRMENVEAIDPDTRESIARNVKGTFFFKLKKKFKLEI